MTLKTRIIPCLDVMGGRAARSTAKCEDAQNKKNGQPIGFGLEQVP